MTDPTFDVIFDDLIDADEDLQNFLAILDSLLPEAGLLLAAESGSLLHGKRPFDLAAPVREKLGSEAGQSGTIVSGRSDNGQTCYALAIPKLHCSLFVLPKLDGAGLSSTRDGAAFLRNTVDLALLKQEHEIIIADKEQSLKQITILKQQHGKLIEDNYRQYRLNQEREKEYARTLESEIAKQTAELREANVRLEEISRLKSDFLANMSHELRTPMNAIIGFTELLIESDLDEEQADYAKTIGQSAGSLLALINDILDLAKIEAGKLELEHIPFNLSEVITNVTAMFKIPAREKNVVVECSVDERIPLRIMGDGNRLRQVLVNLAGNAMKFTDAGRIDVRVEFERELEHRVMARFSVQDTGIGIPADRVDAIFDKFTQADGSTTRKYGGTGLGLAICLQLVELMGGTLSVASEFGKGSTFYFVIPLEQAPDEVESVKHRKEADGCRAEGGGNILLVEDNAVNQRLASILITRQGYTVEVASDGAEALERLKLQEFDLVLMDVQMPNMDGMTATRKIREIEADSGLRKEYIGLRNLKAPLTIVGLTAHARKEDEQACYDAGMNGFLSKPIIKDKLVRILSEMMPACID